MRATPSGGVGSIQDQGVNYIQLNIQPPIPLLNTELRNATLNKDYERSTPLDRAQLTAPSGQPRPARPRMRGRGGQSEKGKFGKRASCRMGASPCTLLPFLPPPALRAVPACSSPLPRLPTGPGEMEARAQGLSFLVRPRDGPSSLACAALPRPPCVEEARGLAALRPRPGGGGSPPSSITRRDGSWARVS